MDQTGDGFSRGLILYTRGIDRACARGAREFPVGGVVPGTAPENRRKVAER